MKTTLFLSTLAAGALAIATTAFAQNFTAWSQSYGDTAAQTQSQRYAAPIDRFTRSDLGYQGKVATQRNKTRASRTPEGPAQEQ
jgi:hypothetical protein